MPDPKPFKLSDARIGQRVVVIEPIGDEIRWKHFERTEGTARNPNYIVGLSLRTVQGRQGKKPRYDSTEFPTYAEWPGALLVVDGATINHDWTEAFDGLMIVDSSGWTGFYLRGELIHKISAHEQPYHTGEAPLAIKLAEALGVAVGKARAIWNGEHLPNDLTRLKLELS